MQKMMQNKNMKGTGLYTINSVDSIFEEYINRMFILVTVANKTIIDFYRQEKKFMIKLKSKILINLIHL